MRMRTCVGCRRRRTKDELLRVVRAPDGGVRLDRGGNAPGRGAYVCPDVRCFDMGTRRKRLGRALKTKLDAETLERLRGALEVETRTGAQ